MLYVSWYNSSSKMYSVTDTDDWSVAEVTYEQLMHFSKKLARAGVRIDGVQRDGKVCVKPNDFNCIYEDRNLCTKTKCLRKLLSWIEKYGRDYHCMLGYSIAESREGWDYFDMLDYIGYFERDDGTLKELYDICRQGSWFGWRVMAYQEYAGTLFLKCVILQDKDHNYEDEDWEDVEYDDELEN